jgi:hypothetical protein
MGWLLTTYMMVYPFYNVLVTKFSYGPWPGEVQESQIGALCFGQTLHAQNLFS